VDNQEIFSSELRPENERYRLIAENPVAGARFFHFIVEMFVKHVLGVNQNHPGLYEKLLHTMLLLNSKDD